MTEEQIEAWVERQVDRLDNRFLTSDMTQAEYDAAMEQIDKESRSMLARYTRTA